MDVILLEKVRNLGDLGETVSVKSGYGRNYLIPKNMAVMATKDNIARFEVQRAELEQRASAQLEGGQARAAKLAELPNVVIMVNAGEEGKLFGSVTSTDIADAINRAGVEVERREVILQDGSLRQVGEYQVEIALHSDVSQMVTVTLEAE